MTRRDLVSQIDEEIADAERSLTFWTRQFDMQKHTEFEDAVRRIVEMHEVTLKELQTARKALIDA